MCHLSRGANCGHSQVHYLHAHLCAPSLSSNRKQKQSEITLRFADGDVLSRLVTFFPAPAGRVCVEPRYQPGPYYQWGGSVMG